MSDTERNLWMADKLGHQTEVSRNIVYVESHRTGSRFKGKLGYKCRKFCLKANAADREAAKIWLSEGLHYMIGPYFPDGTTMKWTCYDNNVIKCVDCYDTFKEALFAAIDYVRKEQP